MSKIVKCDRCGELYVYNKKRNFSEFGNKGVVVGNNWINEPAYNLQIADGSVNTVVYMDLCDNCLLDFINWFNEGWYGKEKSNKDEG